MCPVLCDRFSRDRFQYGLFQYGLFQYDLFWYGPSRCAISYTTV
ncbi:hypothetical protein [Planotetraspora phitsanulokensis]|nr:hypothetical protein [Planotetraspora phitsanulokensis]